MPSHVGTITVGIFLKEEKVEQEEFGGPQAPSIEERNLVWSKASPGAYSANRLTSV
jgi:hypothetical protein